MSVTVFAFYLFAVSALTGGLFTVISRNPVHSVLWLILSFLSAAGLFVLLNAEFVAMLLIIVYVGAVAVLFLFVVMMLDVDFAELRDGFLQYLPIGGVIGAVLAAMEGLGANRSRVRAAIGPTISQAHYEVGPELLDEFLSEDPQAHRFFAGGRGDRLQFDLPGYGLHRLRAEGVGGAEWIRHCTYRDAGRFFSYRRATHRKEADYGRLISVIRCG